MLKTKRIIIIDGVDSSGKSSLSNHIQQMANGKCHILHSNYNKELPSENHRRQHKIIAEFVAKQFDKKHYTGNNIVILDRNYISDMTYGTIGYGSRGTIEEKFEFLDYLFGILCKNPDVKVSFIYCRPLKSAFDRDAKDELLTDDENDKMQKIYDEICLSFNMFDIFAKHNIQFIEYDFREDPQYVLLDREFNYFN